MAQASGVSLVASMTAADTEPSEAPLVEKAGVEEDLSTMTLFTGNANVELASEIAKYLGKDLGNITVRVN